MTFDFDRFAYCLRSLQGGYSHDEPRRVPPMSLAYVQLGIAFDSVGSEIGRSLVPLLERAARAVRALWPGIVSGVGA